MGEMLKAIETIEFWIKPAANINGSGAVQPILVRDIDGMQFIGVEEFALFFEGSQDSSGFFERKDFKERYIFFIIF